MIGWFAEWEEPTNGHWDKAWLDDPCQTDLHTYLSERNDKPHWKLKKTSCLCRDKNDLKVWLPLRGTQERTSFLPFVVMIFLIHNWVWPPRLAQVVKARHRWHFHPHCVDTWWPPSVFNYSVGHAKQTYFCYPQTPRWCGWLATKTLRIYEFMKLLRFFKHAWARKNGKHPGFRLLKLYLNNPWCSAYFHAMDKHGTSTLPRAFANPGQWCWFNAVLQALASIHDPRLRAFKALFVHPIMSSSSTTLVVAELIPTSISSSGKCSPFLGPQDGTEDMLFLLPGGGRCWNPRPSCISKVVKSPKMSFGQRLPVLKLWPKWIKLACVSVLQPAEMIHYLAVLA